MKADRVFGHLEIIHFTAYELSMWKRCVGFIFNNQLLVILVGKNIQVVI